MYGQLSIPYFVDKCGLFWVFCRWNPLQLFWTLNHCFTSPVSKFKTFLHKIWWKKNLIMTYFPSRQIQSGIQRDSPCVWIPVRLLFVCVFVFPSHCLCLCDGLMSDKTHLDLSLLGYLVFQNQSVSGMRRFCRHFPSEPRPVFISATSEHSSHGERWVQIQCYP